MHFLTYYLLLKESVANDVINMSLFAGPVCCEPRQWRRRFSLCAGWRWTF